MSIKKEAAEKSWQVEAIITFYGDAPQSMGRVELPDSIFQSMAGTAAFFLALTESSDSVAEVGFVPELAKVSLCVKKAAGELPKWYVREKGKLYFNPVAGTLEAYQLRKPDWDRLAEHVAIRAKLLLNIE